MHDPAPKGMAHCPHSSIRAPPGPAHFPTVRRTVGTGRDADRPDVLFSSPMAHQMLLSQRLDIRKTPCFPARRLRGAADRIRTCGLSGRRTVTAREFVRVAQLPALVCVWNKQCWIVKFTHQNSWKKKSGQMVVSQPSRVASLQTRLKRLIQKGGHTVKCLACGGMTCSLGRAKAPTWV